MAVAAPSVGKGIALSLVSLALLGVMPIISNLRPSDIGALEFAFALSVWQVVFAAPVFGLELRCGTKGIFGLDLTRRERWRVMLVALFTGALFGLSTYLYVLGATNHPCDVDTALRRPGRFDRMVAVFPPDAKARAAILEQNLARGPHEDIDIAGLVAGSDGFSGADLKYLCDRATENALEASLVTGTVKPISQDDFDTAIKDFRPSTRAWFEMAKNYALFANDGGSYDELLTYLRENGLN